MGPLSVVALLKKRFNFVESKPIICHGYQKQRRQSANDEKQSKTKATEKTNQNNDFIEHDVISNSLSLSPSLSGSFSLWLFLSFFLSPSLYIFHLSHAQSLYPAFGSLSANVCDDYWFRCQFVCCCGARNSSCPMKFCLESNKIDDYCL